MQKFGYLFLAIFSVFYLINPTAGFFELIPDNMPFVGNLDEAGAVGLFLYALRQLGVDLNSLFGKKNKGVG